MPNFSAKARPAASRNTLRRSVPVARRRLHIDRQRPGTRKRSYHVTCPLLASTSRLTPACLRLLENVIDADDVVRHDLVEEVRIIRRRRQMDDRGHAAHRPRDVRLAGKRADDHVAPDRASPCDRTRAPAPAALQFCNHRLPDPSARTRHQHQLHSPCPISAVCSSAYARPARRQWSSARALCSDTMEIDGGGRRRQRLYCGKPQGSMLPVAPYERSDPHPLGHRAGRSRGRRAALAAGLRRAAQAGRRRRLAQEKPGQTLQATALVHEAYLRLVDVPQAQHWNSRGHFFAAAAEAMRRILVEQRPAQAARQARRRPAAASIWRRPSMSPTPDADDLLALDEALDRLEQARSARGRAGQAPLLRRPDHRGGGGQPSASRRDGRPLLGLRPGLAAPGHWPSATPVEAGSRSSDFWRAAA